MIILDNTTETRCCNCGMEDNNLVGLNICHKIYPINSISLCRDCLSMLKDMLNDELDNKLDDE